LISIGRTYTLQFQNVAVSAQQDLFYIKPAADKITVLEAVYLMNTGGTADAGDAQEEMFRIEFIRLPATVTVGSGGTASGTGGTIQPLSVNDAAAGFTGRVNDTAVATTSGTAANIHSDGMNVRVPYVWLPPPEHRILVANAQALVVRLVTTPADAVTMDGTALIREIP
jgi:hypothetical protein